MIINNGNVMKCEISNEEEKYGIIRKYEIMKKKTTMKKIKK